MDDFIEWRPTAYSRSYWVNTLGDVMSINERGTKPLKPQKKFNGYVAVNLYNNKKMRTFSIHKLVMETFYPNRPAGSVIDHIDFNKENNNIKNLRYVTQEENLRHTIDAGRKPVKAGSKSPASKLTREDVFKVVIMRKAGIKVKHIADHFTVSQTVIHDVLSGKSYKCEGQEFKERFSSQQ
jgi:hypothetical protein